MIKISRLADYAVMTLGALANAGDMRMTAARISECTNLPEPTSAKVLKLLAKSGIITSVRGVNGGYILTRKPEDITVAEMVAAVDGPVALTLCAMDDQNDCGYACSCPMQAGWGKVNEAVVKALANVTLHDLLGANYAYTKDEAA